MNAQRMQQRRQQQLHDYVDGRLPLRQREAFEVRLRDDAALRADLAGLRRTLAVLRADAPPAAPEPLTAAIMRDVRALPVPQPRWTWAQPVLAVMRPSRLGFALAGAAVALFAVVQLGLVGPPGEPVPSASATAVQLSAGDQAFVQDCLQDYHFAMAGRLGGGGSGTEAMAGAMVGF